MPNFGGAAAGAIAGMQQVDQYQAQQLAQQQMRQQAAERQAAQNAQQAAMMAYRKTMSDIYGPQPPMPGQPSVPMQQPPQGLPPTAPGPAPSAAPGAAGMIRGAAGLAPAAAPALPPYRALQRDQQPTAAGPAAPAQQFELPPKPARPQLDMQAVMKNAPQDPEAFDAYMTKMTPYLSSQAKSELEQQKLELRATQLQNNLLIAERRLELARTPDERAAAQASLDAYREEMLGIRRGELGIRKEGAEAKKTKGSEKQQAVEDARAKEQVLVDRLIKTVTEHPEVVGLSGKLTRAGEWIGGATGASQSTVAHDFQTDVRDLQNIIKKIEAFGPEGRVLKGELADRDVIVRGLGAMESAPSVLSNLMRLKGLAGVKRGGEEPSAAAKPAASKPIPKDRNRVIKDIMSANGLDPNKPEDVKRATEFAKKEGLIK